MRIPQKLFYVLVLATFLCLFSQESFAQSAAELAKVEKQLSQQKESAARLEAKEKETGKELEELREKLVDATDSLRSKEEEQKKLEASLTSFEKEVTLREAVLSRSRGRLNDLISALLQLTRRPPALFLMLEDSEDDHVHRTILLRSMLPHLRDETVSLAEEIRNYEELRRKAASQKRMVAAARQNLEWQRHSLDQMIQSRQGLLQKTVVEKEAMTRQLKDLAGEAKDLRQLMEKVSNPSWGNVVGKAPSSQSVRMRSGLKMPVVGDVIRDYGAKDDFGVESDGITIVAAPGSLVVAPQSGKVVFVGPFRGYGQIVILQHPKGYHSFLAGFGRIDADMGQEVEAGEPLGVLVSQGNPELYFEWRKGNDPVSPVQSGLKR